MKRPGDPGRYSPAQCIGTQKKRIEGNPDAAHVSTSYVERQNFTMRISIRRFERPDLGMGNEYFATIHEDSFDLRRRTLPEAVGVDD